MEHIESYATGDFYDTGSFDVSCNPLLYGPERITLEYRIYSRSDPKDLSEILTYIQEVFRQAYDQVLSGVFSAYKHAPKWDVWMDETKEFLRIDFTEKEELHPYIGRPIVELAFCNKKAFWGLTFPGGTNKLSFEHGFCTVFEQEKLLVLADNDLPSVLKWWDHYSSDGNMLPAFGSEKNISIF